jgi:2-hydroxy-3-keto-5-methylthiopentenyl-1-phosphate phosphatase
MNIAILCDFDETAAQQNVAHLVLNRFGESDWRALQQQFHEGTLRAKEYFERPFDGVTANRHEMQRHVREHGRLRDGFVELAHYCRDRGIELAIVTHGMDFYVEALLAEAGLEWLPTYAVHTTFTDAGIQYDYRFTRPNCVEYGNCKCSIVDGYKSRGRQVFYVGDGITDLCPARKADLVFARSRLLEECQAEGLPHVELRDFSDVITEMERRSMSLEAAQ